MSDAARPGLESPRASAPGVSPRISESRIYVAGHRGMVGAAIVRRLRATGCRALITRTRAQLDLTDRRRVHAFFQAQRPDMVFLAAAKVGGILANNSYPADFIRDNLAIELNIIDGAYAAGAQRLLFLGSSCIYPRLAEQPMREEALLTGPLEPTNEPYALAKIAGIKLCESYNRQFGTRYRCVMPTNLYGPGDNFDLHKSHVIPALIRKVHEAKQTGAPQVEVWGTGRARRELLYVDDMADACVFVMGLDDRIYERETRPMRSHINVGTGSDLSIRELAETIAEVVGFEGRLHFDTSKPDGAPRKLLDVSRLERLGWKARTGLHEGLEATYAWMLRHQASLRR